MFVHLHTHSHYSLLEGISSPKQLAERAQELGNPACALTDRGVMYGAIEFYKACKILDVRPVIGSEMYIAATNRFDNTPTTGTKKHNVVLLAKTHEGYKNLLQLTTKAFTEGFYYKPRIDKDLLKEYSKDLICLSSDIYGELSQAILRGKSTEEMLSIVKEYQTLFGTENYFLELQHHPHLQEQEKINKKLIELSKEANVPLVVTNNVHYARPEDQAAHEVMLCLQTGKDYDDPSRFSMRDGDYSLNDLSQLEQQFPDVLQQALENTVSISEQCSYDFTFGTSLIPSFDIPEKGYDEVQYFRKLCWEGMFFRYEFPSLKKSDIPTLVSQQDPGELPKKLTETSPEELKLHAENGYSDEKKTLIAKMSEEEKALLERLEYEMCVIKEMGFCTYFLIVQDFVMWAKDHGIAVGPGRGSAAGSIIAYVLQITDLDPITYDLLFERFLNPARVSMPDIDLDFEDARRTEVLDYVTQKYGSHNVAQICTFGSMKAKQAVKDVGRSLGLPYQEMDGVAKMMTEKLGTRLQEIIDTNPEIKEVLKNKKYKKVFDLALKLEGVVRQIGVHACAVIISEKPLTEYTALQYPPKDKKYLVTQYSMKPLEELGLLKMDFLGLRNLTILRTALKIIARTAGKNINISTLPIDDKATYELFARGETKGVFQFESEGMRKWLKEIKPDCFEDIIAMVSMYRPGPMAWIPVYIGKKHNLSIQFPSKEAELNFQKLEELLNKYPDIKKILDTTNLIPIYQEQILQIAQKFSGFSLGEADLLRRAIGKKIVAEMMAQKEKFIERAGEMGNSKEDAKFLFERGIEPFADYGFNKSHAACYALIAYQTAYLKAHHPTEFMTALLSTVEDNTEKLIIQIEDCASMGITILPPDVNESLVHFTTVKEQQIRFGLNAIKGFGEEAARVLIQARNDHGGFKDLEDFITKVPSTILNKKSLEALSLSGALDSLGVDRKTLFENIDSMCRFAKEQQDQKARGQTDIFGMFDDTAALEGHGLFLKETTPSTKLEQLAWEREYLGFYVTGHPLQGLSSYIKKKATPIEDLKPHHRKKTLTIVGLISKTKKIMTKNKELMAYLTVEGNSKCVTCITFPKTFAEYGDHIKDGKFIRANGTFDVRNGEAQFVIREVKSLDVGVMIKNARLEGSYEDSDLGSIGISHLVFTEEELLQKEEVKEKIQIESTQTVVQAQEKERVSQPIEPYVVVLKQADVATLSQLKKVVSTLEKGTTQIVIEIQGKKIETPYMVSLDEVAMKKIDAVIKNTPTYH